MSFKYDLTANQQTPTSDSKVVLCKSFKIDIANGSGFLTATTYDLGWLPNDAQVVHVAVIATTAVSGGTVSVATMSVQVGGGTVVTGANVFTQSYTNANSFAYNNVALNQTADQKVVYIPTLTGAGATAGVIYVTIFYVV